MNSEMAAKLGSLMSNRQKYEKFPDNLKRLDTEIRRKLDLSPLNPDHKFTREECVVLESYLKKNPVKDNQRLIDYIWHVHEHGDI
jgi:hypothetical protein